MASTLLSALFRLPGFMCLARQARFVGSARKKHPSRNHGTPPLVAITQRLEALQPWVTSKSPNSPAASDVWSQRIQQALRSSAADSTGSQSGRVLILRTDESDVLASLLADGIQDTAAEILLALQELRSRSRATDLTEVIYGETLAKSADCRSLRVPVPWLRDAHLTLLELRSTDFRSEQLQTHLYLASQILLTISYLSLFSPSQPTWLPQLASVLNVFEGRSGLRLIITHNGEVASPTQAADVRSGIQKWIHSTASQSPVASYRATGLQIDFVDLNKAREAQAALRGAMGFRATDTEPVRGDARSRLWSQFQYLSAQSGIPSLISSLSAFVSSSGSAESLLSLLAAHSQQHIASRLALAEAELGEVRSLSSWLRSSSSTESSRLTKEILASVSNAMVQLPKTVTSKEPPLLPSWWKVPWIGDAGVREQVQERLEKDWLGGKEVEDRLTWWGGRVVELEKQERTKVNQIVQRLLKGQHFTGLGDSDTIAYSQQQTLTSSRGTPSRTLALPPSLLLALRAAFALSAGGSSWSADFSDLNCISSPNLLAQPVIQTRSRLLGRRGRKRGVCAFSAFVWPGTRVTGTRATPTGSAIPSESSGASLLDELQRRFQTSVYRFWAILGTFYGGAAWGSASHALFHRSGASTSNLVVEPTTTTAAAISAGSPSSLLLDMLTYPNLDPATSLGVVLLGTALAFWTLQRSHTRLAKMFLDRDVLERMPQIALAEVRALSDAVGHDMVFKSRQEVGRVLQQWIESQEKSPPVGAREEAAEAAATALAGGVGGSIAAQRRKFARLVASFEGDAGQ